MEQLRPLTAFFDRIQNDGRISSTHIGIFAALLHYRKQKGFVNPIAAYSRQIMPLAKISALKTYCRCLKDLDAYGYLRYLPSKKKTRPSIIHFME
ncbi:hypothetical protein FUA48_09955 [Flavobacterium alkalisoli]|uniref:Transcriptional regulator n=2 Tax=Flavobacterium alkalisoli TaxID=2602769 RepID=A0A5B9FWC1_9FLAO|nr:hypothetical protein FUA48_09955 [Flavobacterium alkalisoli]